MAARMADSPKSCAPIWTVGPSWAELSQLSPLAPLLAALPESSSSSPQAANVTASAATTATNFQERFMVCPFADTWEDSKGAGSDRLRRHSGVGGTAGLAGPPGDQPPHRQREQPVGQQRQQVDEDGGGQQLALVAALEAGDDRRTQAPIADQRPQRGRGH